MSFTSNPWRSTPSKYEITVNDQQTIQQVIDGIPVMAGSLASGITNHYIVNVPPGHEKEYYSLVRDASDAASDKRNVKVIFEDNPEGKYKITAWNDCNKIGWDPGCWNNLGSGGTVSVENVPDSDQERLKIAYDGSGTNAGAQLRLYSGDTYTDLREYQGLLVTIEWEPRKITNLVLKLFDINMHSIGDSSVLQTQASRTLRETSSKETFFVALHPEALDAQDCDISKIGSMRVEFSCNAIAGDMYLYEIQLVRTTQTKRLIIDFHDSRLEHYTHAINELEQKGWKGNFATIAGSVDEGGAANLNTLQAEELNTKGHLLYSHGVNGDSLHDKTYSETSYAYHASNNWLLMHGLRRGFGLFGFAGYIGNVFLKELMKRAGAFPVWGNNPPYVMLDTTPPGYTALTHQEGFHHGGNVYISMHDFPAAADLRTVFDYIEQHFSEVILLTDVIKQLPDDWPIKFEPNYSYVDPMITKTLSADYSIRPWEGGTFSLDPGGANRNIVPIGLNSPYAPGHKITLINIADAAETLTFDPLFTSSGTSDNTSDLLTFSTGAWIAGQLVGRTVNNTTDSSTGVITANTSTTVTAILSGGANNSWTASDSFTITPIGSDQDITQGNSSTFIYDGEGWH